MQEINKYDDNCYEGITFKELRNIKHLPSGFTYYKLLEEIDKNIHPLIILKFNFDYETARMLLDQAKERNINFYLSNDKRIRFIMKCNDKKVRDRLFCDEGYNNRAEIIGSILDQRYYTYVCNVFQDDLDLVEVYKYRHIFLSNILAKSSTINYDYLTLLKDDIAMNLDYYKYYDYNDVDDSEYVDMFVSDLIAGYFFSDVFVNVSLNIKEIIKYSQLMGENKVDENNLYFYQEFIDLKGKSIEEKRLFFLKYQNINMVESFYDDIRKLRDESHYNLVKACTQFTKDSPLYNKEYSDIYGCDIYYLNGEDFYGFVRSDIKVKKYEIYKENGKKKIVDCPQPSKEQILRLGQSFSYIGKYDIQTYLDPSEYLTMLYDGIDYKYIGHVYCNDAWTSGDYSDCNNELHTPESLLKDSSKYPEIVVKKLEGIKPIALMCLDIITEWDINFSINNNIPIALVNSRKYPLKSDQDDVTKHFKENRYFY